MNTSFETGRIGYNTSNYIIDREGNLLIQPNVLPLVPYQITLPNQLPLQPLKCNQRFYVHTNLTINLGIKDNTHRSYLRLVRELQAVKDCDCACVVHIGRGKDCNLYNVIEHVQSLVNEGIISYHSDRENPSPLLLENAAGQGYELGSTWDQLRHLREAIDSPAVSFCFDTQHAFAAGLCDYSSSETINNIFAWGQYLSPGSKSNWGLIHLNDSKTNFGSRVDRHEVLGQGKIWRQSGRLLELLSIANNNKINMITETKDPMACYNYICSLCASVH